MWREDSLSRALASQLSAICNSLAPGKSVEVGDARGGRQLGWVCPDRPFAVLQSTLGEAGLLHMFPLLAEIICDVPDSHKGTTAGGTPPASPAAFRRRQRAAY